MPRTLYIKAEDDVKELYENHSTYHDGDAGLDLFFPDDVTFLPGETKIVDMKIRCEMVNQSMSYKSVLKTNPPKYEGKTINEHNLSYYLYPRSSMSKTPLMLANHVGIFDAGYRGPVKVALRYVPTHEVLTALCSGSRLNPVNLSDYAYTVSQGDRLVQICLPDLSSFGMELSDELSETTRGEGGFGSTGK